jgi:FlaA1/EpsC-like NDP-sugar epimerase
VQQIELEVEPPYWRQSWFYASEFAFFTILVVLSLKLSSGNSKYQYISRLLSVLTVIMLIQFIQTVVSSQISIKSTPVIDFFIQVFIALLILPIEGLLRKFIIRSSEDQGKTAHLWDESGLKN